MKKDNMPEKNNPRRDFLKTSATALAGFYIVPRHVIGGPGYKAPSDKLMIAGIGVGGKGYSDIRSFYESGNAEIVALCDVDDSRAERSVKDHPKAKYYRDYREMLEKERNNIDAVSVSTPDHNHAVQTLMAMQMGKHVYVQKPLTHTIHEARVLTEAAEKYKVVTQMGNQGASGDGVRQMREWYAAGLIGEATKVHCWTDRPVWPQGVPWPETKGKKPPKNLDWDLWLGTAQKIDYVEHIHPFNWRGWWAFGTGALGDMACHIMEPPFRVLDLGYPTEAECSVGTVYVDEFKRGYFPESYMQTLMLWKIYADMMV
jgi:predicted dehydrogenase